MTEAAAASAGVVFAAAQADLMARSTRVVARALRDPRLFVSLPGQLRREAQAVSSAAMGAVPGVVRSVVGPAASAGAVAGERSAQAAGGTAPWWVTLPGHQPNSASKVAQDLTDELRAASQRITRFADDAYRAAVAEAAALQTAGHLVPKAAQAHAWATLMGQGVTGFTDKAGRNWNLASYTEMAVRTAAARAFRDSQRQRMQAMGISFFTITADGHPCPLCAPWEGRVLSDTGAGTFTEDGVVFDVAGTIEEAVAAGLWHPNCKHSLVAFRPGVTVLQASTWTAEDEARYKATQQLRALERDARAAKAQHANALTPAAKADARRRVTAANAAIAAHAEANGLLRRRNREQPNLGFKPHSPQQESAA